MIFADRASDRRHCVRPPGRQDRPCGRQDRPRGWRRPPRPPDCPGSRSC